MTGHFAPEIMLYRGLIFSLGLYLIKCNMMEVACSYIFAVYFCLRDNHLFEIHRNNLWLNLFLEGKKDKPLCIKSFIDQT